MAGLEERKQLLFDDPDLSIVEPHRVFCNRCDKWLKLDETKLYAASVWRCHKNTKSHNARPPNLSAPAPQPLGDEKLAGSSIHRNAGASRSFSSQSKGGRDNSLKASPPRRASTGDQSQPRHTTSPSSASTPVTRTLPRLTIKMRRYPAKTPTASMSGDAPSAVLSSLTSNGTAPVRPASPLSRQPKHPTDINGHLQSTVDPEPDSKQSERTSSQKLMPPPVFSPTISKVIAYSSSQSDSSISSSQLPGPPQMPNSIKSASPMRSVSLSVRDGVASPASAGASRTSLVPPERLSPHRKASYKALVADSYIGKLEPFRAFCTLCDRWVDLSSRTPYSYGVWKGHVRKTDKHNRLQTSNADDDYETASEHSHDEFGAPAASNDGPTTQDAMGVSDVTSMLALSSAPAQSKSNNKASPTRSNNNGCSPRSSRAENDRVQPHDAASSSHSQHIITPESLDEASSSLNPFTLKAITENSFASRNLLEPSDQLRSKGMGFNDDLLEGHDMPDLTESSEEEASTNQVPQKPSALLALQRRRDGMLTDPDAAIVEARRVKCRLCDRWIKGSNTQEYSLHHWLKHKKKCSRTQYLQTNRSSEPSETRKARLEADTDMRTLEPHRALCGLCNKWVKLCGRTRFSASHWLQHKKKCLAMLSKIDMSDKPDTREVSTCSPSGNDKRSNHKLPSSGSTPESRRAMLLADLDILQLFPDRVQCKPCNRWIKLSISVEYSPSHWLTHKESCPGLASDQSPAAIEARKDALEADPDVTELEPHRARCAVCNLWVKLRQDCSYNPGKWEAHKRRCGLQTRGRQIENGLEAEVADESDEFGDDDREAMDVEHALKAEADPKTDKISLGFSCQAETMGTFSSGINGQTQGESNTRRLPTTIDSLQGPSSCDPDENKLQSDIAIHRESADGDGRESMLVPEGHEVARRRMRLLTDPDVLGVEPRAVMCRRCQSRVSLGPGSYVIGQWLIHKENCRGHTSYVRPRNGPVHRTSNRLSSMQTADTPPNPVVPRPVRPLPKGKGKGGVFKRVPSPMTLPPLPARPRWPGEDERKQQFINDPDVLRVEPHRLLCKHCNCWIRLHPIVRYCQSVWPRHKASCKDVQLVVPGDAKIRAKSEKEDARKQMLDDDPYATDIGPHRVTCKACGTSIRLDTTYKYEGSHWRAHRSRCTRIPFHERQSKKRKTIENARRLQDALQGRPLDNSSLVHEAMPIADSSDSDNSDASSAPRPRPTSFFTAPLEIDTTKMFIKRRQRPSDSFATASAHVAAAKAQTEAELAAYLQVIAAELTASNRLVDVIESAGDCVKYVDQPRSEPTAQEDAAKEQADDMDLDPVEDGVEAALMPRSSSSPTPDPETWVPSKRTREEQVAFNAFFSGRPAPPTPPRPKGKLRVCNLEREAVQALD